MSGAKTAMSEKSQNDQPEDRQAVGEEGLDEVLPAAASADV